ncbi:MAG: serine hydrolase [Verrucomicrobia bacterium]|nr:serine hydrolase [Verrucomicrobiota bacterium]
MRILQLCLGLAILCSIPYVSKADDRVLRVAILADEGAGQKGITNVTEQLRRTGKAEVVHVTGKEIASGILAKGFDVVVFTGGSGSKQGNALGDIGRENVRNFVREGGGYVGICAGAYLACTGFSWGVGVLDAKTIDSRWRRGTGNVKVELTAVGQEVTGLAPGVHDVRYANGPILTPHGRDNIPPYEPVAFFRTELAKNDTPEGIMVNAPAIARGTFGKGRVVVSSPHPESTEGLSDSFAPTAIRWAAGNRVPEKTANAVASKVGKPSPALHPKAYELGQKIQSIQERHSIVGLSVVAVKNGTVVWHTNFGLADIEREMPVTDQTMFRIASISKTIATAALMQLWEQGKFKLDDDISSHLGYRVANPRFPETPITFRQLLTHTSSLTDNANYDRFLMTTYNAGGRAPDIREILNVEGTHYSYGANFTTNAPGTNYRYCNLAFGVVGTLVEKLSGERFYSYCSKNILEPLGITASFNVAHLPDINDLAVLYSPDGNDFKAQADNFRGVKPSDRIGASYQPGQNGLVSGPQGGLRVSALDLSKFMTQFMDRKSSSAKPILKKSTIDLMLREHWTNGKNGGGYAGRGLGFQRTQSLVENELWIGHTGSAYGLRSSMFFLPKESIGIILITNGSKAGSTVNGFYPMHRETTEAVLEFLKAPPARKSVTSRR